MKNSEPDIELVFSRRGAEILINNRSGTNILHTGLLLSFREMLHRLKAIGKIRTVVIASGNEGGFAAGADMEELRELNCARSIAFSHLGQSIFIIMSKMPALFIAAIDGYCIGGGFDLALACDIIVMSQRSFFQHPGTARGFITGFGGNLRLSRATSFRMSTQALMLGRNIDATESKKIGLGIVQPAPETDQKATGEGRTNDGALTYAREIASRFSSLDTGQIELLKRTTRTSRALSYQDRIGIEARLSLLSSIREKASLTPEE